MQVRRDDSFNDQWIWRHSVCLGHALENEFGQQATDLIAIENHIVIALANNNSNAVRIWVCTQNQISFRVLGQFDGHGQGLRFFRVRIFHCWKAPVWFALFGRNDHIGETKTLKAFRHRKESGSMKGCVDDFEFSAIGKAQVVFVQHQTSDFGKIDFVQITTNLADHFLVFRLGIIDAF